MLLLSQTRGLLHTTSVVALSAAALMSALQPAAATNPPNAAIYAGGSTLASQAFRQLFDCYMGRTVTGDGFTFSTVLAPGSLPTLCTTWALIPTHQVEGLYAGVGSGNGFRGYISNNPDEWYGGNVAVSTATIAPPFPAAPPPFVDPSNVNDAILGSYPYPHVDIGLSDSPLANQNPATIPTASYTTTAPAFTPTSNWTTPTGVLVSAAPTVTYSAGSWGSAIQIPAFEVGVGIAINTAAPTTTGVSWHIQSNSGLAGAGSAIQLSEAQLCAIFSGLVTDWADNTTSIPVMTGAGQLASKTFGYANTNSANQTPQAYALPAPGLTPTLPVIVVFRSDGSGTSFIMTNYLHNVCPLIDGNAHGYQQIFAPTATDIANGYKALPSTTFADLQNNVEKFRSLNGPNTSAATNWVPANASGGVAASISDGTGQPNRAGYIGYLSADFTSPYATSVTGVPGVIPGQTPVTTPVTVDPPLTASLQNEALRTAGVDIPGQSGNNFVAPTPTSVNDAWADASLLATVNSTSTAADWNVYASAFPATQPPQGGYAVANQGVLPLTLVNGAYPLSGTTFLALYSCYNSSQRVTNVVNFLKWLYNGSDGKVSSILQNNGFHGLAATRGASILQGYLSGTANNAIADAPTNGAGGTSGGSTGLHGCTNVASSAGAQ